MRKILGIAALSVLMVIPFFIFNFIFVNVPILIPVTAQLLMLFPLMGFKLSGAKIGIFEGLVFSTSWLFFNILFMFEHLNAMSSVFLVLFVPVSAASTGIASKWLEDRRAFVFPLVLAILIQLAFHLIFK